ncbi:MAG: hypothetical protein EXQ56_09980 [Acidobacteria bacterium]|nr:hypothetical protein [Acidobacteriota bacterium]
MSTLPLRRFLLWLACCTALITGGVANLTAAPIEVPPPVLSGFELLRNGHYSKALEAARHLAGEFPAHPLPPLLEAQAHFDLIFCQTGHINAKELWHFSETPDSPLNQPFARAVDKVFELSAQMKRSPETSAEALFYEGTAHGFRARLHTLREQMLPSGREGKQMREALLKAVALDPTLAHDAGVGLGIYDYYADSLSPLIKFFRFFLFIPGGNMERGIAQLHAAADTGNLFSPEARWELARIIGVREGRHEEAVKLLVPLVHAYPDNALFALLTALEAEAMGNLEMAREYAQRALEASARMDVACRPKLEPAALQALDRIMAAASEPRQ